MHGLNGRELIVAAASCFFYKPVSFTEGGLWPPALSGGSSISVVGGCGGLPDVPVNFNHINLSWPLTEGMSALYSTADPEIVFWIMWGNFWEQRTVRNTLMCTLLEDSNLKLKHLSQLFQLLHNIETKSYFVVLSNGLCVFTFLGEIFMKTKSGTTFELCTVDSYFSLASYFKLSSKNSTALPYHFPTVSPVSHNYKSSSHHMGQIL